MGDAMRAGTDASAATSEAPTSASERTETEPRVPGTADAKAPADATVNALDATPDHGQEPAPTGAAEPGPVPDQRVEQAGRLAAGARDAHARLPQEFDGVAGAEQPVNEARKAVAALEPAPASAPLGTLSIVTLAALGLGFYAVLGLGIAAIFSTWAFSFWTSSWKWVLLAFALIGVLHAFARWFDAWLRRASEETARKVFALVTIPTITAAIMGLIAFGSTRYLTLAAQLIIIPVTALLPAVTYFLFLATRRPSILNEFIGNLGRLGLLARRPVPAGAAARGESNAERGARVESYFQRFEAIYGALRFDSGTERITRSDFVDRLINLVDNPGARVRLPQAAIFIGDIFNANLVIPIGLVTILATLGWLLVLQPNFNMQEMAVADLTPKPSALNFAFLGAYFFGIQMLFRRFVRRDLGPNAYFVFSNRIILAVIGVWLVTAVYAAYPEQPQAPAAASATTQTSAPSAGGAKSAPAEGSAPAGTKVVTAPAADTAEKRPGLATKAVEAVSSYRTELILLLAFTIGVFPRLVWQFLTAAATKLFRVKLVLPSVEAAQPLYELDGLTVWHETRLEEEDVENVPNMASVDIVELMLHTQIPMERLVSWIDQAILLTVLGVDGKGVRDKLRKFGLRTATQVVEVAGGSGTTPKILIDEIGADHLTTLVLALRKEANFDRVRAWREL